MKPRELLSLCRELKGLTLRDVEKATGISNAAVSQYENGRSDLGIRNAIILCDFYGLSLDRLADTYRTEITAAQEQSHE